MLEALFSSVSEEVSVSRSKPRPAEMESAVETGLGELAFDEPSFLSLSSELVLSVMVIFMSGSLDLDGIRHHRIPSIFLVVDQWFLDPI